MLMLDTLVVALMGTVRFLLRISLSLASVMLLAIAWVTVVMTSLSLTAFSKMVSLITWIPNIHNQVCKYCFQYAILKNASKHLMYITSMAKILCCL